MFEVAVMELRNPIKDIMAFDHPPKVGEIGKVIVFDGSGKEYPAKCVSVKGNLYSVDVYQASLIGDLPTIEAQMELFKGLM